MKTTKSICLSLLVLAGALRGTRADALRTDVNPALLYYTSFLVAPGPMSEADRDYLGSKKGREQKLPERFGQILSGYDNQFRLLRQAAHATVPCDWGIDLSAGPNTMLPHLGRGKAACQAAQYRAVWDLQHGREEDARDDLLAAFVLGRNAGSDPLVIGALVQDADEAIIYATVAGNFGQFSPETLKELVDGFDAAPPRRTIAACIPSEKHFADWMSTRLLDLRKEHPDDDTKVMAGFHDSGVVAAMESVGNTNFWPLLVAASGGTSEGILKLLRETEPVFPRVAAIMALPQPEYEAAAKQFSAEAGKSQNPFLKPFDLFTGWILGQQRFQPRPREFRAQAQEAMVHAAVEYRLHGESGIKNVMDPFGNGPFDYQRFVFKGVDRGFELRSAYAGADAPFVMLFLEKEGQAFQVTGPDAGQPMTQ
jgi:hypothetical protein